MTVFIGATGSIGTGAPELGADTTAFQPFTNTALSFNSRRNEISLLDPSLLQRIRIVPTGQTADGVASFTPSGSTTALTVNLPGALAVDSIDNLALAVNSGSSNVSIFQLGNIKPLHVERVVSPLLIIRRILRFPRASLLPSKLLSAPLLLPSDPSGFSALDSAALRRSVWI